MTHTRRAVLIGVLVALASSRARAQAPASSTDAPRIEAAELKKLVDKGDAVLLDVRSQNAWDMGHAEGAIHIPLGELSARLDEVPRDKLVAAYCT